MTTLDQVAILLKILSLYNKRLNYFEYLFDPYILLYLFLNNILMAEEKK